MELVDFLHVPEDDELPVDDAWRDLLHSAGHFPQVGLARKEAKGFKKKKNQPELSSSRSYKHSLRAYVQTRNEMYVNVGPVVNMKNMSFKKTLVSVNTWIDLLYCFSLIPALNLEWISVTRYSKHWGVTK